MTTKTEQPPALVPATPAAPSSSPMLAGFQPQTLKEATEICGMIAKSGIVPLKSTEAVFAAGMLGARLGLDIVTACQHIAVVNGKPMIYGDAPLGLVQGSGKLEYIRETDDGKAATCIVKRVGQGEISRTFSMDDARTAKLLDKSGPWSQYPARMRQMRARAWALRDAFPDVLMGLSVGEEYEGVQTPQGPEAAKPVEAEVEPPKGATQRLKAKAAPKDTPEPVPAPDPSQEAAQVPERTTEDTVADYTALMDDAESTKALRDIGAKINGESTEVKEALKPVYAKRHHELEAEEKRDPGAEG